MEKGARTRLTTALVLVVVFASGMTLGLAMDRSGVALTADASEPQAEEGQRERRTPMWEQVGPDEAQKMQIDSVVKAYRETMRALQSDMRDAYNTEYQSLIEQTRTDIKGVLTPDQAVAYDSLVAAYEKRRAERGSRENRD
jgi:hypothetical protein